MAGMLPGVETARKRRIHQSHGNPNPYGSNSHSHSHSQTRHYNSFSLFPINSSYAFSKVNEDEGVDEKLGEPAREAKQRLEERLRPKTKSVVMTRNKISQETISEKKKRIDDHDNTSVCCK